MNETPQDVSTDLEGGYFDDSDILMSLRDYAKDCLVANGSTVGENSGCGCGSADIEMELEGVRFNVSISLVEVEN